MGPGPALVRGGAERHRVRPVRDELPQSQPVLQRDRRQRPGHLRPVTGRSTGYYFIDYPEDIRLYGLSFQTNIGSTSVAGELSYGRTCRYKSTAPTCRSPRSTRPPCSATRSTTAASPPRAPAR
ncbi:DUF1302 family protein [Pseudomonas aeruginosa]